MRVQQRLLGEYGTSIPMASAGSEITSLVGKLAGFKVNDGASDEYFIAKVESSTSLVDVKRGNFFDSTDAPVDRLAIADGDTITLLRLTWVFAKSDGTSGCSLQQPKGIKRRAFLSCCW